VQTICSLELQIKYQASTSLNLYSVFQIVFVKPMEISCLSVISMGQARLLLLRNMLFDQWYNSESQSLYTCVGDGGWDRQQRGP